MNDKKTCVLCGNKMQERYITPANKLTGSARAYTILWCEGCGFGRLDPCPTRSESEVYHEAYFAASNGPSDRHGTAATGLRISQRLRNRVAWALDWSAERDLDVVRAVADDSPLRICEFGCGNGDSLSQLRDCGHDVVGIEPSATARERARAKGLDVRAGTAEDLPADIPAGFDLVTSCHVLEHCLDPVEAVTNMVSLLRPGGRVVCSVPNFAVAGFVDYGPAWWHADIPRHVNFFTPRSLSHIHELTGLRTQRVEFMQYARQFSPAWLSTLQRNWDVIYGGGVAPNLKVPRPTERRTWWLLARSAFAASAKKYDSMRIVAVLPGTEHPASSKRASV